MTSQAIPLQVMSAAFMRAFPHESMPRDVESLRAKVAVTMQSAPTEAVAALRQMLASSRPEALASWVEYCQPGNKTLFAPRPGVALSGSTTRQFTLAAYDATIREHVRHPGLAAAVVAYATRSPQAAGSRAAPGHLGLIVGGKRSGSAAGAIARGLHAAGVLRSPGVYGQGFGTDAARLQSVCESVRDSPKVFQLQARALVEDVAGCARDSQAAVLARLVLDFMNGHRESPVVILGTAAEHLALVEAHPEFARHIGTPVDLAPDYTASLAQLTHPLLRRIALQDVGVHTIAPREPGRVRVALEGDAMLANRLASQYAQALCDMEVLESNAPRKLGSNDHGNMPQVFQRCAEGGGEVLLADAELFLERPYRSPDVARAGRGALLAGMVAGDARIFVHGRSEVLRELMDSDEGLRSRLGTPIAV